ncbi:MAG: hypothetical protein Q9218_003487 [Villophora microphyllina]
MTKISHSEATRPSPVAPSSRRNAVTPEQLHALTDRSQTAHPVTDNHARKTQPHDDQAGTPAPKPPSPPDPLPGPLPNPFPPAPYEATNTSAAPTPGREAIKPKPWTPPRPPRPDEVKESAVPLEETSEAAFTLQSWIRLRYRIAKAKDNAPPGAEQALEHLKGKLGAMIKETDTASLVGVLEMYCRSRNAPKDVGITRMLLHKLGEKGVMKNLWEERAFLKLVEDADWGVQLTRLFSYGFMGKEEVDAAVGADEV